MTEVKKMKYQRDVLVQKLLKYSADDNGKFPRSYWALKGKIVNINKTIASLEKSINWENFLAR